LQRFAIIAIAAVVTGLIVGVVIADSGDGGSGTPSVPELKPPPGSIGTSSGTTDQSTTSTDTTSTSTPTATSTTPSSGSGGTQAPQSDTPQHDVSPPQGSPADKFEQFCKDNPGAC
jgi:hypothetical protein